MDRDADPQAGHFTHGVETETLQQLRTLQGRLLASPKTVAATLGAAALEALLADDFGGLNATGPATTLPGNAPSSPARMRSYAAADRRAELRITDTGRDPTKRHWLLRRLLLEGDDYVGFCKGEFVAGQPAVVSHFKTARGSWVQVLVDDRFIVDLRVEGVGDRHAAADLYLQLDLSGLPGAKGRLAQRTPAAQAK